MRSLAKPCRASVELTDAEDDAFTVALERNQERADVRLTRQSVLRQILATYCKDAGVRFPAPTRKGKRVRGLTPPAPTSVPTQTPPC